MSANDVDRAINGPLDQRGAALTVLAEDQWFERKSRRVSPKDLAMPLVAFANAEGGTIVLGIHNGRVEGMKADPRRMNEFRQAAIDFTVPPVRVHADQIACLNAEGDPDVLLVLRVSPGEVVHETQSGDCYLRIGDESRKLNFHQRQELHYDRGMSQFDGAAVSGSSMRDLDTNLVSGYRASAGFSGTNTQLLRNRGLLKEDGTLTNAGYLLFGDDPMERMPHACVRIVRYRDDERGSGRGHTVEAGRDTRIGGPIPRVIEEARAVIEEWQPKRSALGEDGRFIDMPVVPRDAWLEGLVNAVVHRSYSLGGDHIRVEIFPRRIEITSPGRFPGLANPGAPLDISRYARNPRIARVCTDLRITRELGEGIRRMFDEMRALGLADPSYVQTTGSVTLRLLAISRVPEDVLARLPRGAMETLGSLRAAGTRLGTGDVQALTGLSRPTVVKQLNALREEDLVEWSGKSARDPRATWFAPQ